MSNILKSSIAVSFFLFLNVLLMFMLEMLLARYYGTRMEMDCYLSAVTLPDLLVTVAITAFNCALVPTLVRHFEADTAEQAYRLTNSYVNIIFLIFLLLAAAGVLFAAPLIRFLFTGFDQPRVELSARLMIIYFPVMIFRSLTALLSSIFYAERRFFLAPLAPVAGSVVAVILLMVWVDQLGIYAAPVAVAVSSLLQFALLFAVYAIERKYRFEWHFIDRDFRAVLRLMWPLIWGGLITKAIFVVDRSIASGLNEGAIAALGYANKIVRVLTLVGLGGLSITSFPALSALIAQKDWPRLQSLNRKTLSGITFITLLIFVLLAGFSATLVRIMFQYGAFTAEDTVNVGDTLVLYGGVLVFGAIANHIANLFFALPDTRTPTLIGIAGFIVGYFMKLWFSTFMSYRGIALASTLYFGLNLMVMIWFLQKKSAPVLDMPSFLNDSGKLALIAAICWLAGWGYRLLWPSASLALSLTGMIGVAALFMALSYLFHIELRSVLVWDRLFKRRG